MFQQLKALCQLQLSFEYPYVAKLSRNIKKSFYNKAFCITPFSNIYYYRSVYLQHFLTAKLRYLYNYRFVFLAKGFGYSGSNFPVIIQDCQAVNVINLNRIKFVFQNPNLKGYFYFYHSLNQMLFCFIFTCDFNAACVFYVFSNRAATLFILVLISPNLSFYCYFNSPYRSFIGLFLNYLKCINYTVKRISYRKQSNTYKQNKNNVYQ